MIRQRNVRKKFEDVVFYLVQDYSALCPYAPSNVLKVLKKLIEEDC